MPGENPAGGAPPAAPAAAEPTKEPPAGAAPAKDGGAPPAAAAPTLSPEEIQKLREDAQNWNAVNGLFRKTNDGALELDPSLLPPAVNKNGKGEDDPDAAQARADQEAAAARRQQELTDTVRVTSDRVSKDLDIQETLKKELVDEPGGEEIFNHAKSVMQKVPIEQRSEKAWRNSLLLARGATEKKRRDLWIQEGRRQEQQDLAKNHGMRIPKPAAPVKTEEEMVDELTDKQKEYCRRAGVDPKAYAKRQAELKGGGK